MLAFSGAVKQEFLDGRAALQDQVYIRAHAVDFFISLLTTVDDWAERTLAEIQGWKDLSPDGKNDRGLQIMAQLPAPTAAELHRGAGLDRIRQGDAVVLVHGPAQGADGLPGDTGPQPPGLPSARPSAATASSSRDRPPVRRRRLRQRCRIMPPSFPR
jgi:hypothetical protein